MYLKHYKLFITKIVSWKALQLIYCFFLLKSSVNNTGSQVKLIVLIINCPNYKDLKITFMIVK